MRIFRLENPVQRYNWGSSGGLTEALGVPNPGNGPLAELWMGAHPRAPSQAYVDGKKRRLDLLIAEDPVSTLGKRCVERFGQALPFLFKALSAASPLSIQAHPGKRKAQHGYDRENLAGIPLDSDERNYRDPNHKPEMIVALTPFALLCGFRPIDGIIALIEEIAPDVHGGVLGRLYRNKGRMELSVFFYTLLSMEVGKRRSMLEQLRRRLERGLAARSYLDEDLPAIEWVLRLMQSFPDDMGALCPLILNLVTLEPGEAVFIAPGELHAHLEGSCLELMANSDNVIRGALTRKHVDLPELVSVLSFNPESLRPVFPEPSGLGEESYPLFVPDFQMSRIAVKPGRPCERREGGPEILLCSSGVSEIVADDGSSLCLSRGESVFVAADSGGYRIRSDRESVFFKAFVPEIP